MSCHVYYIMYYINKNIAGTPSKIVTKYRQMNEYYINIIEK